MKKGDVNFNVYLGTVRGALAYSQCKKDEKATYNLEHMKSEITALEWGRKEQEILVGQKNGKVFLYNIALSKYTKDISEDLDGDGAVVGFGTFDKSILIGRKNGVVNIWSKMKKDSFKLNMDEGAAMECMIYNRGRNIIATGGENNNLKLWDVEKKEAVFKAKSMQHDPLNLSIPTTIRGICFFPSEENLVAVATKEGLVLLYDERVQRKPIVKYDVPDVSYTAIATTYRDRQCFVGTTKGYLHQIDLRENKRIKMIKSFTGGISSIVCDPTEPYVATACLDRHLRIHDYSSKDMVYKEYMKIGLTKVIMKPVIKEEKQDEDTNANVIDKEYEDLFENMETIVEKPIKNLKREKRKSNVDKKVKMVKIVKI